MAKKEIATTDNDMHISGNISEEGKKALEEVKKMQAELYAHRHPRNKDQEFVPINGIQIESDNSRKLEAGTYKQVEVGIVDAPIKAVDYDKREEQKTKADDNTTISR